METILRIGQVTDVNKAERLVRVQYPADNIVSGWLKVLKSPPFIPEKDVEQRTESKSGGSGDSSFESHYHNVVIKPWLPSVGETVLCIYNPGFNEDGFVLGAL